MSQNSGLNRQARIKHILSYIEKNLVEDLSVDLLAEQSSWSRWQLQRVFALETGLSVAKYVRELRLSLAAEKLLTSEMRHLDIALSTGFDSEISFNRSFKQIFGSTPGAYQRRGKRIGLRKPIAISSFACTDTQAPQLQHIKVESKASFELLGTSARVHGLFSDTPDFIESVPAVWERLRMNWPESDIKPSEEKPFIGVIDTSQDEDFETYWACIDPSYADEVSGLQRITVPEQEYAVIPYKGSLANFNKALQWFILSWLPDSGYTGVYGFDIERYTTPIYSNQETVNIEYWVPIQTAQT